MRPLRRRNMYQPMNIAMGMVAPTEKTPQAEWDRALMTATAKPHSARP